MSPSRCTTFFAKAEEVVSRFFSERVDDPARGTIEIHGERYVLLRAAALSVEFFDLVRSLYGEDRRAEADEFARTILFDLAHAIGRTDARNFHEQMNLTDPIARLSAGPIHFAHTGWAFVEILPESKPSPDAEYCLVYDHPYSFESNAWVRNARHSDVPVCIMNAGYSSGWCEESFGLKLVAAEILCRAKGDETCRFVMAPPERISGRISDYVKAHPDIAPRAAHFRIPDFFARKREEENLKKRQDELERELRQTQKLEALGRLAGGIAHDFNNIISVVLGQAALAQRQLSADDPLAEDLAKIIRAGERAASLTQKLLTFGRSQVAQNDILDLNVVVDETAKMIERVIGDDVELSLQLAHDAGNVRADRSQLEQVLMNLAVNARDAMPNGGRFSIATSRNGDALVDLVVSDTGSGMDDETRQRAFEPFFTTKADRGTGLGLFNGLRNCGRRGRHDCARHASPGPAASFPAVVPPPREARACPAGRVRQSRAGQRLGAGRRGPGGASRAARARAPVVRLRRDRGGERRSRAGGARRSRSAPRRTADRRCDATHERC